MNPQNPDKDRNSPLRRERARAVERHPREWHDYGELLELQALNPDRVEVRVLSFAEDGAPLGYDVVLNGWAGPVVDVERRVGNYAPVKVGPDGKPLLVERFTVRIAMMERYPFVQPQFYYVDPVLAHPYVRYTCPHADLYPLWKPIHTLVDAIRRLTHEISYQGLNVSWTNDPLHQNHILNPGARDWVTEYVRKSPDGLPFLNHKGEMPSLDPIPIVYNSRILVQIPDAQASGSDR